MVRFYNRKTDRGTACEDIIRKSSRGVNDGKRFIMSLKAIQFFALFFNHTITDIKMISPLVQESCLTINNSILHLRREITNKLFY